MPLRLNSNLNRIPSLFFPVRVMIAFRLFIVFFFFLTGAFAALPRPKVMVSFEGYCKKHPEQLVYTKEIPPYNFDANPISKYHPTPWLPAGILLIPEGKAVGKNGAVIGQENVLLRNSFLEWSKASIGQCMGTHQWPEVEYYDAVIAEFGWVFSDNYYHWMIDVLPRIGLIEEAGIHPDLYHIEVQKSFQKETLALLGIENQVLPCKEGEQIQARSLLLPSVVSFPFQKNGRMKFILCAPFSSIQYLREKFLLEKPVERNKRIYISRKGASCRKLLNEEEVVDLLESYGFVSVQLETLTVQQQVQLFASAEIIVAPHGAGLTNLVFCEAGTKVIELVFRQNYLVFCFWAISQQLGLDHRYIECSSCGRIFEDPRAVDVTVDLYKLEKELEFLQNGV